MSASRAKKEENNNKKMISSTLGVSIYDIIIYLTLILHTAIIIGIIYALFIPTLQNDPAQTFPEGRQFKTSPFVPFGNDHRNEFGDWYGILLAFHSIFGWILGLFVIISSFPNIFGNGKLHEIIGIISILFAIITVCAAVPMEISLITSRGYLACQWKDYSFSVYISIHFTQWFLWIIELLNYSIITIIYKNNILSYRLPYFLKYLSICSIIFNIWKCGMWFIIYFNPNTINCTPLWRPWFNLIVNILEIPTIKYSIYNIKYIEKQENEKEKENEEWIIIHRINSRLLSLLVIITIAANIVYKLGGNDNAMCGYLYLSVFLISIPILYFLDFKLGFLNNKNNKIKTV